MSKYAVFVRGGPVLEIVDRPHELTHIGQQLFIGALGPVGSVCVLPCSDDVAATFGDIGGRMKYAIEHIPRAPRVVLHDELRH